MSIGISSELITTIIATLGTLGAALVSSLLTFMQRREKQRAKRDADVIVETVRSEEEGRKAAVMEAALERVPEGLTPEQFKRVLEEIVARLPPAQVETAATPAVEELVNNYHEQALDQAKAQFWFSIIAATVGFGWILYSGASIQSDKLVTVSKTFPGIVMDAVAFLFFRQASETRQRATELYDRLRKDKQMAESSAIVASIEDIRLRSAVKAQLALHMSGLEPKPIDLGAFLSAPAASATLTLQPTDDERLKRQGHQV